jgi:hypothetical protein
MEVGSDFFRKDKVCVGFLPPKNKDVRDLSQKDVRVLSPKIKMSAFSHLLNGTESNTAKECERDS